MERFTGYVGQSRPRQPTHTWNVTRVPEVDFGGVPADQRNAENVVLDALRRQPDTGFAIHDAPSRVDRLLAEQSELRHRLRQRPPDNGPALRQAEFSLASAEKDLYWAHYRLEHAEERLAGFEKRCHSWTYGRDGIRANCVCPGAIETPMLEQLISAEDAMARYGGMREEALFRYAAENWRTEAALGRFGHYGEVADVVTFLLSDRASYVTGALVNVDGGTDF